MNTQRTEFLPLKMVKRLITVSVAVPVVTVVLVLSLVARVRLDHGRWPTDAYAVLGELSAARDRALADAYAHDAAGVADHASSRRLAEDLRAGLSAIRSISPVESDHYPIHRAVALGALSLLVVLSPIVMFLSAASLLIHGSEVVSRILLCGFAWCAVCVLIAMNPCRWIGWLVD